MSARTTVASGVCKRCREVIRTSGEALLIELGSDESYLIHATLDCYESEVEALLDRYLPADARSSARAVAYEARVPIPPLYEA